MKATIEFDDDLYRRLKSEAALRGRKVKDTVTEGVQMMLNAPKAAPNLRARVRFPLIKTKRKKPLEIPDDISARVEIADDLKRHETSLR